MGWRILSLGGLLEAFSARKTTRTDAPDLADASIERIQQAKIRARRRLELADGLIREAVERPTAN